MKCPRRIENSNGVFKLPDQDSYGASDTCNYCGSLNPATFMKRLELGDMEVGPTDKNYKVYVKNKGGEAFKMRYRKDCTMGDPDSQCTGPDNCTHWVTEDREHSKFYFQHLSEAQMKLFIELLNEKKINIGVPGHFYTRPFFMASTKATS